MNTDDRQVHNPSTIETTVLVIDDEESVLRAYARLFRSAGLQARTFASVEEFLQAQWPIDHACVISDVRMPGKSGLELPQLLAESHRTLPVIFVTAHDTEQARDAAREAGAAAYFRKPVDDQALLDAIAWALKPHAGEPSQSSRNGTEDGGKPETARSLGSRNQKNRASSKPQSSNGAND